MLQIPVKVSLTGLMRGIKDAPLMELGTHGVASQLTSQKEMQHIQGLSYSLPPYKLSLASEPRNGCRQELKSL